ncbi:isopeptide-forming domain-containing fimbrial protein [Vagococcus sp. DIV0080]|uniref:Isopeptide-forming domain-containing fimbrial protein n=1 Tax=Candidatus Vagococcus giribetii TaxID=2230876 RepID=A0ABS3HQ80_9ENTE|nr:isopeptide-forming domain-containing fimbrial protein [Vagococcus sp. DIV0080]MBO0475891.1 isopeptide-forming domain-containing fimbrial protein [Vagococcus sp. DIV0080]
MKKKIILYLSAFSVAIFFLLSSGYFVKANNIFEINIKKNGHTKLSVLEGKQTFYTLLMPNNLPDTWQAKVEADESLGVSPDLLENLNEFVKVESHQMIDGKDVITFSSSQETIELGITATQKAPMNLVLTIETESGDYSHELMITPTDSSLLSERSSIEKIPQIPAEALDIDLFDYFGIVGDASVSSEFPNTLIPVPDATFQKGAMWSQNKINLKRDFSMEMFVYLHEMEGNGLADGITVTLHNDPRGVKAIGGAGAGIGAYPINGRNSSAEEKKYIENAISAEFDPHLNEGTLDDYDSHPNIDGKPHIAVVRPKPQEEMRQEISRSHAEFGMPITHIDFDVPHWNVVTTYWTASEEKLRIGFEELQPNGSYVETAVIESHLENHEELFGGDYVHWGATGSTGENKGAYYIAMKKMPEIDLGEPVTDVINLSNNEKFGDVGSNSETVVEEGDEVEYRLTHVIDGNNTIAKLKNYRIEDELPKGVTYIPNSTTYTHYNIDTGELLGKGKISDDYWNKNKLDYVMEEEVKEDSEIVIHYQAEFNSSSYKKEELPNSWAYTTTNGFGQKSTEATLIKERTKYEITEQFVDNETGAELKKEEESLVDISKSGKTWFKREPEYIEGYELEKYTYQTKDDIKEVEVTGDDLINFELTDDTEIVYYYRLADFSPRINLRTKNNKLLIHYRNVDQLHVFMNDEMYKIIDVETKMSDETLTLPLRVDSDRTKISVQGKLEGDNVVNASLNRDKK